MKRNLSLKRRVWCYDYIIMFIIKTQCLIENNDLPSICQKTKKILRSLR